MNSNQRSSYVPAGIDAARLSATVLAKEVPTVNIGGAVANPSKPDMASASTSQDKKMWLDEAMERLDVLRLSFASHT